MEWRIFIIGPMGSVESDRHFERLELYIREHLRKQYGYAITDVCRKGDETITIVTAKGLQQSPERDVPTKVFEAIDGADLVVANLTGNRPAVIYELALAHALGIRTILVGDPEANSFYLSQTEIVRVDLSGTASTSVDLGYAIDGWLAGRNKYSDIASDNPLVQFYRAPLPDISTAAGLAAGYFANFVWPVLHNGQIVRRVQSKNSRATSRKKSPAADRKDGRAIRGLIVLRPAASSDLTPMMKSDLQTHLVTNFGDEVLTGDKSDLVLDVGRERPMTVSFMVKDYVIDIPTPLSALSFSPRLKRIADLRSANMNDPALLHMKDVLISHFFESVKKNILDDKHPVDYRMFHVGVLDEGAFSKEAALSEISSIIKTGKSKTWRKAAGAAHA